MGETFYRGLQLDIGSASVAVSLSRLTMVHRFISKIWVMLVVSFHFNARAFVLVHTKISERCYNSERREYFSLLNSSAYWTTAYTLLSHRFPPNFPAF
jgi:hypothetical protein